MLRRCQQARQEGRHSAWLTAGLRLPLPPWAQPTPAPSASSRTVCRAVVQRTLQATPEVQAVPQASIHVSSGSDDGRDAVSIVGTSSGSRANMRGSPAHPSAPRLAPSPPASSSAPPSGPSHAAQLLQSAIAAAAGLPPLPLLTRDQMNLGKRQAAQRKGWRSSHLNQKLRKGLISAEQHADGMRVSQQLYDDEVQQLEGGTPPEKVVPPPLPELFAPYDPKRTTPPTRGSTKNAAAKAESAADASKARRAIGQRKGWRGSLLAAKLRQGLISQRQYEEALAESIRMHEAEVQQLKDGTPPDQLVLSVSRIEGVFEPLNRKRGASASSAATALAEGETLAGSTKARRSRGGSDVASPAAPPVAARVSATPASPSSSAWRTPDAAASAAAAAAAAIAAQEASRLNRLSRVQSIVLQMQQLVQQLEQQLPLLPAKRTALTADQQQSVDELEARLQRCRMVLHMARQQLPGQLPPANHPPTAQPPYMWAPHAGGSASASEHAAWSGDRPSDQATLPQAVHAQAVRSTWLAQAGQDVASHPQAAQEHAVLFHAVTASSGAVNDSDSAVTDSSTDGDGSAVSRGSADTLTPGHTSSTHFLTPWPGMEAGAQHDMTDAPWDEEYAFHHHGLKIGSNQLDSEGISAADTMSHSMAAHALERSYSSRGSDADDGDADGYGEEVPREVGLHGGPGVVAHGAGVHGGAGHGAGAHGEVRMGTQVTLGDLQSLEALLAMDWSDV